MRSTVLNGVREDETAIPPTGVAVTVEDVEVRREDARLDLTKSLSESLGRKYSKSTVTDSKQSRRGCVGTVSLSMAQGHESTCELDYRGSTRYVLVRYSMRPMRWRLDLRSAWNLKFLIYQLSTKFLSRHWQLPIPVHLRNSQNISESAIRFSRPGTTLRLKKIHNSLYFGINSSLNSSHRVTEMGDRDRYTVEPLIIDTRINR